MFICSVSGIQHQLLLETSSWLFLKIRKGAVCLPCWFWCCQTHSDLWAPRANSDPAVHRSSEALAQSLLQQQHQTLSPASPELRMVLTFLAWGILRGHTTSLSPGHWCHCWCWHWRALCAWPGAVPARPGTKLPSEEQEPRFGNTQGWRMASGWCCHHEPSWIKREWSQSCCYLPVSLPYSLLSQQHIPSSVSLVNKKGQYNLFIHLAEFSKLLQLKQNLGWEGASLKKCWNCSFLWFKNKSF